MDILNLLLQSGLADGVVKTMSEKTGLDSNSVSSVLSKVAPIFMQKAQEKLEDGSGEFANLANKTDVDSVKNGNVDTEQGNALLGFLTGSKENSKKLASEVGSQTGVDSGLISKMLPMIAPVVVGFLSKNSSGGNGIMSSLTGLLDKNHDGSVVDDVMKMASGFLGGNK